jgi:PAS domain S-box-containing protein
MTSRNAQQVVEYAALQARVAELEAALEATLAEQQSAQRSLHDLAERVKELSTLYALSRFESTPGVTLTHYLMELVAILPAGWQYPEDTCVSVSFRGQSYATPNYHATPWQLRSAIAVYGRPAGTLTVGYLSPHPPDAGNEAYGPFLAEERSLIDEIARRVGRFVERTQADEAQRHLAAIVEFTENAIFSRTLDGMVLTWNSAAEQIFGYSGREMIGQQISRLLTPAQIAEEASVIGRLAMGYRVGQFEARRRCKDGREIDVTLVISPIRDHTGQVVGVSTIASDITERKQVETILHESEERFRATFEQAAVGIAHIGLDGRFLRVNQKLCELLGYTQADLMRLTFQEITAPGWLDAVLENIRKVLAKELTTYTMEQRYVRKDSTLVWANLTGSLARAPSGEPRYFISVIQDISRRKGMEEALRGSEARYRDLFENSPISLWEQDFSAVKQRLDALRAEGVTDFRAYLATRPGLVAELVGLVKNVAFNQASLELYGACDGAELLGSLDRLVPPAAHQVFIDELVWIAEGRTSFSWEGPNCKCSGEIFPVRLHWSVAPTHEHALDRVLVSVEDITPPRHPS